MADSTNTTISTNKNGASVITTTVADNTFGLTKKKIVFEGDDKLYIFDAKTERSAMASAKTKTVTLTHSSVQKVNKEGKITATGGTETNFYTTNSKTNDDNYTKNSNGVVVNTNSNDYENARKAKRKQIEEQKNQEEMKNAIEKMRNETPLDIIELKGIVDILIEKLGGDISAYESDELTPEEKIEKYQKDIFNAVKKLKEYVSGLIKFNSTKEINAKTNTYTINFCSMFGVLKESYGTSFNFFDITKDSDYENIEIIAKKDELGKLTGDFFLDVQTARDFINTLENIKNFIEIFALKHTDITTNEIIQLIEPIQENNDANIHINSALNLFPSEETTENHGSIVKKDTNTYNVNVLDVIDAIENVYTFFKALATLNELNESFVVNIDSGQEQDTTTQLEETTKQMQTKITDLEQTIENMAKMIEDLMKLNNVNVYTITQAAEKLKEFNKYLVGALENYLIRYQITRDQLNGILSPLLVYEPLAKLVWGHLYEDYESALAAINEKNYEALFNNDNKNTLLTDIFKKSYIDRLYEFLYKGFETPPTTTNITVQSHLLYIDSVKNEISTIVDCPNAENTELLRNTIINEIIDFFNISNKHDLKDNSYIFDLTPSQNGNETKAQITVKYILKCLGAKENVENGIKTYVYDMENDVNKMLCDYGFELNIYKLLVDTVWDDEIQFEYPNAANQLLSPLVEKYWYEDSEHNEPPTNVNIEYKKIIRFITLNNWWNQYLKVWLGDGEGYITQIGNAGTNP